MNEFDWDVLQKKRVASGAYHIKRGSRSKKCTLPSDYLTAGQKRRLNGDMETYNLTERMDWKSFKKLPTDLKTEYMQNLVDRFDVGQSMAAKELFYISDATLSIYLKGQGLSWPKTKHGLKRFPKDNVKAWREFRGLSDLAEDEPDETEEAPAATRVEVKTDKPAISTAELVSGSLTLCGSAYDIASKLVSLLGANGEWRIRFDFEKEMRVGDVERG